MKEKYLDEKESKERWRDKKSENELTLPSNRWTTHFRFTSVAVFDWADQVDIKFLLKDWICFSEFLVAFSVFFHSIALALAIS